MRYDSVDIFCFTPPVDGTFPVSFFQRPGDETVLRVSDHRFHTLPERGFDFTHILLNGIHQFFPRLILLRETRDFLISLE